MPHARNDLSREQKSAKKKKTGKDQLQNFISLHINDDAKRMLEKLTKTTSKSVTEIMGEAIEMWSSKRRRLCLD